MRDKLYILDGHTPVHCTDLMRWGQWVQDATENERRVGLYILSDGGYISTLFLALDYRIFGDGPPLIFETRIFGGPRDGWMLRCSTWEEAEANHQKAIALVTLDVHES